jgi:predicted ester cyclase
MMTEDQMLEVVYDYVKAYNSYDIHRMEFHLDEFVHFSNTFQGLLNRDTKGLEQFREQAIASSELFENRKQEITSLVLKPESITANISFEGIASKNLGHQLRKGESLFISGKSTFEFKNGKVIRIEDVS